MNCPEHKVFLVRPLDVCTISCWMYWCDVPRELVPLRAWLNPLRYELSFYADSGRGFTMNREGIWWRYFSNFLYRIGVRY